MVDVAGAEDLAGMQKKKKNMNRREAPFFLQKESPCAHSFLFKKKKNPLVAAARPAFMAVQY